MAGRDGVALKESSEIENRKLRSANVPAEARDYMLGSRHLHG